MTFLDVHSAMGERDRDHASSSKPLNNNRGVALFLAISLLALFSVLGATYMRFMSLELDESNLYVRNMRIRQYADAGVYNAAGHIRAALAQGAAPLTRYAFPFAVYGDAQNGDENQLRALSTYTAEALVSVEALDRNNWESEFPTGPAWPGEMKAFRVTSRAELQRAVPGGIRTMAAHNVAAIISAGKEGMEILHWRGVEKNVPPPDSINNP